ncbi:MarR family winged helix-turn-helix transcriptional regulator [Gordonia caeni]|uniref:HTH marR-type domain-containing protein n=1 Tax=Gordonia caeni TaxID=1007097 RepID=A0ABP7P5B6_9ACTN
MRQNTGEGPELGDEASRRLGGAMGRLEALRRHRVDSGAPDSPGTADMRLLWLLRDSGPQTLSEITAALGLERSTVNRQVNAAVDAGLLDKTRVSGSSAHRVALTGEGQRAFERGARHILSSIERALAEMGPRDAMTLIDLVERFVDVYGRQLGDPPKEY